MKEFVYYYTDRNGTTRVGSAVAKDKAAAREKAIERCHVDRVVFARMRGDA